MKPLAPLILIALVALACESSQAEAPAAAQQASENRTASANAQEPRRVAVTVDASGYEPSAIEARAGEPLTLAFTRTTDEGCGQQLVFPERDLRRDLPLNQEVEVELTPRENETIAFTCGMGMYRGSVVASAR